MTDEYDPTERFDPTEKTPEGSSDSTQIGPYALRQQIGEGGMGEVWLAEQRKPIQRKVALKIIKKGMDSKEIAARFEAERQALALMNHPSVAKVHDAGTTPDGRPYFVMEYVPGIPITSYCDRHKLGLGQRLELFRDVCDGVQHAHQKAIIHRDLKPSNVLVMEQDEKPLPKIIDFGVAKAISHKLTEQTMFTQLGVLIGTPEYMSPEQAELTGEDVDTRTDVYSLGVILYELLVGALPFEPKEMRQAGFEGIRRIIREMDPPRPSTRISTLGEKSSISAGARRTTVPSLQNQLRGDLDWITMKALEKDRGRRYSSPMDLARDLERHLRNLPVEARPPTLSYRAGRFVRRNRTAVIFAAVLGTIVLGSSVGLALLYTRSLQAERRATREASTAQEALTFMTDLFRGSDPFKRGGAEPTARELLDNGADRLAELDEQPEVQIRLMRTIGDVYRELGDWEKSREILELALERQIKLSGSRHQDVADAQYDLAYNRILAEDYDRAFELMDQCLELRTELFGERDRAVADVLHLIAFAGVRTGRFAEAERRSRQAQDIVLSVDPDDEETLAMYLHVYGWALAGLDRPKESRAAFEESLRLKEKTVGYETPATAWTLNLIGWMLTGQQDEADIREGIARLEEALALNERLFDGSHVEIAYCLNNIAKGFENLGDHEKAVAYCDSAIEIGSRFLDDRGNLGKMKRRLAYNLNQLHRYEESERVLVELYESLEEFPDAREQRSQTRELLRSVYQDWGRPEAMDTFGSSHR